jgi:hypothetical protein
MDSASDGKDSNQPRQKSNNPEKRGSGIFRFGKAIASAFHPFGTRGNKSEVWKGSQDGSKAQKELMKQRQARAETAYAELKKSGYKGTRVGNGVDPHIADETWKVIQEKMDYKMADNTSSHDDAQTALRTKEDVAATPVRHDTGLSKLKSFSELRKRTSTLNLPSIRHRDVSPIPPPSDRESEDSHRPVQRRQSRKELSRQAKLLKKVSNLEDKLERARRELRNLSNEDEPPMPSICVDGIHTRKFVPGALPSLPSERLLHNQVGSTSEAESGTDYRAKSPFLTDNSGAQRRMQSVSLKPRKLSKTRPSSDSLTRKRKSSADANKGNAPTGHDDGEDYDADCGKMDTSDTPKKQSFRQAKSQKTAKEDSPGSKCQDSDTVVKEPTAGKLKATRDKRSSSLTTKSSQRLKAKQSSRNLRQIATDDETDGNMRSFYLQEQRQLESNIPKAPSPSKGGWGDNNEENIPPVPPVPKDLLENAAKLSSTKAGSRLKKIDESNGILKTSPKKNRAPSAGFAWPEDIF